MNVATPVSVPLTSRLQKVLIAIGLLFLAYIGVPISQSSSGSSTRTKKAILVRGRFDR